MKSNQLIILTVLACTALLGAQDEESAGSSESAAAPVAAPTTVRILGTIPDGTPPKPSPPKPKFVIPEKDILDTRIHEQGGRTVTIRRIKPIAPPLPPAPAAPASGVPDSEFRERLAEYRAAHPSHELLFLGVTVFRSKDSPPRTLVRWWPQGERNALTFWSSADFAIIAGGINSFADTEGNIHSLLMGWGIVDIDRMTNLFAAKGRDYAVPDMPDFPAGKAVFEIFGNQPAAEELVAIQSLHDIYNDERSRLETAFVGREKARIEREAYLKAHPPQPENITLNYWRTEKPAAKGGRP